MRFVIIIAGALAAAFASSCAPRGERSASHAGGVVSAAAGPTATAPTSATPSPASPAPSAELGDLLVAAGLSVPKTPIAADDFRLASLGGGDVKLSDYRGRLVFLNFWATWCPPCRGEMPSMERLHRQFHDRGLEIVAVDLQESAATVRKFITENSFTFTVLLDTDGAVGGAWGAQSIPTTYLIDRTGTIIARAIGGREWDTDAMVGLFKSMLPAD